MTGLISSTYFYPVFALVLGYLIYERRGCIPISALMPLVPLVLLVFAGMVFIDTRDIHGSLRDLWYVSKIILIAMTGLLVGVSFEIDPKWFQKLTAVVLILAFLNLARALLGPDAEGSRYLSYFAALMGPFILRYHSRRGVSRRVIRVVLVLLVVVMVALSGSRAGLLTLIVAYLASRGIFERARNTFLAGGILATLALAVWPFLPQYDISEITFLGKVQNSISELTFETGEDRIDMYANWRGFEAYRAYETWLNASFIQKIVGLGFGERIDLGKFVAYGSDEIASLPFVHNAYFTLLVKTGIFGIATMVYALFLPFRIRFNRHDPDAVVLNQISCSAAVVLLLTMALIAGPLNKESMDGVVLLWAWSSGALFRIGRQVRVSQAKGNPNDWVAPRLAVS
ncbi:O-antigen ligase family protein [Loktanella salsilacus]|uniref:O-antigen ligase family protein n=1 Tax=Loktanella salsilacus TaxID=195913 RepID=UPI0020B78422|nr:O-antigen ligase family protein [Loktanella salsilacus]UTH46205.1 O-antigen ligase family protein [Loktanella salsilacus]